MLISNELDYIKNFILKSGEQLDLDTPPADTSFFTDVKIVKRTARKYRIVGLITFSEDTNADAPDEELLKLKLTPNKKI
ncbi:MAG: hypothetical protein AB2401_14035, partial [Bacillus sp. (in: firmicutes)]